MRLKVRFYICQLDIEREGSGVVRGGKYSNTTGVSNIARVEGGGGGGAAAGITSSDIFASVRGMIADTHGDVGIGNTVAMLAVKFFDPRTRLCIVRGPSLWASQVRSALVSVKKIKNREARLSILHVAGSVRTASRAVQIWHTKVLAAEGGGSTANVPALSDNVLLSGLERGEVYGR
jgi:RNase P/RNase MRP subunit POP5